MKPRSHNLSLMNFNTSLYKAFSNSTGNSLQVYPLDDDNIGDIRRHLYLSMFDFLHSDCFLTDVYPFSRRDAKFSVDQTNPLQDETSAWTILQYWNS